MTSGGGRSLRVALLQLRAFELADHEAAWAELLRRIDEAAEPLGGAPAPQLIVAPEASYPAYYLHSRADYEATRVLPDARVEAMLAERARRHGVALAVGLVQRGPDEALPNEDPRSKDLRNVAVLFAPSGQVVARTAKRFLWHFDRVWFGAGQGSPVVEVGPARCGLFICADGRLPEIPRALAVAGAELLIDPTAWVSGGRDPAALSNPQVDYMLAARAIENGCWIVAADKVGSEAGTIVYAGRSGVVDPRGRWRAQAPSDEPGIVRYTIELDAAPNELTAPPVARRPELYAGAAVAGAASRAATLAREPLPAEAAIVRVAAAALDASPSAVELMERVRALARSVATQDGQLLVLSDLAAADAHALSQRELLPLLEAVSAESGLMLAVTLAERAPQAATSEGGAGAPTAQQTQASYKTLYLLDGGALLGAYRQTHLDAAERAAGYAPGGEPPPVIETRLGAIGLLAGRDALVPELARGLKLGGAELLAWCGSPLHGAAEDAARVIARTRAAEQRLYVVASAGADRAGGAFVVDPSGAVAAESLAGEVMAVAADAHRALARWHRVAPGTDPILAHRPEAFPELFDAPAVERSAAR